MAPKNKENNSRRKKQVEEEGDEDYRKRRDRNNQVIRLSIFCASPSPLRVTYVHQTDVNRDSYVAGREKIQSEEQVTYAADPGTSQSTED